MDAQPTLSTFLAGQEKPLGPAAARWALTYRNKPRKAAAALAAARRRAHEARQAGDRPAAEEWEEIGGALEAILARKTLCRACGRHLHDPVSVARGVGPDCWEKQGHPS